MGGAPTIVWLRDGVGYAPDAAASMRRLESELGRHHDCNSSYRDWNKQLGMYNAWNAYVAGRGPHPGHSRAIHPDQSMHCKGLADDSDDWTTPGYIALAERHGWIRTAANDPTERHHFEYQWWRDQHRNDPAPAGEEEDMKQDERDALFDVVSLMGQVREEVRELLPGKAGVRSQGATNKVLHQILAAAQSIPASVWRWPVKRAGKDVPAIQELADAKTNTLSLLGRDPQTVDVDEQALAAALAPLIGSLGVLSDEDVKRLADAAADEADRRERERLGS